MPRPGFGTCPLSVGVVGGSSPWVCGCSWGRRGVGGAENNLEPSGSGWGQGREGPRAANRGPGPVVPAALAPSLPLCVFVPFASFRSKRSSEKFQGDLSQAEGEGTCPRLGGGRRRWGERTGEEIGRGEGARARARAGVRVACWPGGPGRPGTVILRGPESQAPQSARLQPPPPPTRPPPRLCPAPRAGSVSAAAFPERHGCTRVPVRRETEGHCSPRRPRRLEARSRGIPGM